MGLEYFRPRDRFDFSKNTLDIGNYLQWSRKNFLKHFFLRIFAIDASRWPEFYNRHLTYYLKNNTHGKEEYFFKKLWSLIETRLKTLVEKDIYESKNHVRDQQEIEHLKSFTEFLTSIDKWHSNETEEAIKVRMLTENQGLQNQLIERDKEIKLFRSKETTDKINIHKDSYLILVDLFLKLQELKLDDDKELVFARTQAVWMKMINKYFTEDHKEIKIETLKRYFPADKNKPTKGKHSPVPADKRLFNIVPAKRRS
jgi:hypothetical protein